MGSHGHFNQCACELRILCVILLFTCFLSIANDFASVFDKCVFMCVIAGGQSVSTCQFEGEEQEGENHVISSTNSTSPLPNLSSSTDHFSVSFLLVSYTNSI